MTATDRPQAPSRAPRTPPWASSTGPAGHSESSRTAAGGRPGPLARRASPPGTIRKRHLPRPYENDVGAEPGRAPAMEQRARQAGVRAGSREDRQNAGKGQPGGGRIVSTQLWPTRQAADLADDDRRAIGRIPEVLREPGAAAAAWKRWEAAHEETDRRLP